MDETLATESRARALAQRTWQMRHRFELIAAARFGWLADELAALGAHGAVATLARTAAADELRHAARCRELVVHYGGALVGDLFVAASDLGGALFVAASGSPASPLPSVARVAPAGLSRREALLYEVVAMSCVTETLSTALLGELVDAAGDAVARAAMHEILRDEVNHSRLGWAHIASEHERGSRDVVGPHLPAMLRHTVEEELFSGAPEDPAWREVARLGALSRASRLRIFADAMRSVVFPGLARFGVDTTLGAAWLEDKLAEPASA